MASKLLSLTLAVALQFSASQMQSPLYPLYTTTIVNGKFITVDTLIAATLLECIAQCLALISCSVVQFTGTPKSCKSLDRTELEVANGRGAQVPVYVDASQPSKLPLLNHNSSMSSKNVSYYRNSNSNKQF